MLNKLICRWKGHHYDFAKYRLDLKNHFKRNIALDVSLARTLEDIKNYYNNPPKPFCLRCKRETNDGAFCKD